MASGALARRSDDERLSSSGGVGPVSTQVLVVLERVEASVGERPTQRPDSTDVAIGGQHANELPTMHWRAIGGGHNRQADTVGEGEVGHIVRLVMM